MAASEAFASHLQAYITRAFPQRVDCAIHNFESLNVGWESDVYAFTMVWGPPGRRQQEDLILRIYPGQDAVPKSGREYRALKLLRRAGYPVPAVYHLEQEHSPFGKPFLIMERIHGRSMWGAIFHSPAEDQQRYFAMFCELFARLHNLAWKPAAEDPTEFEPSRTGNLLEQQFARWQRIVETVPLPGFLPTWHWINEQRQDIHPLPASIVHWDFHPENMLLQENGEAVVIDWTGFEISDRRFDIAWTLLLITTIEGLHWRDHILSEYERHAGITLEDMEFFEVVAGFRRLYGVIASFVFGADKLGMRPGAEEIMRRHKPYLRLIYEMLLPRTGLAIPEVEAFLNEP